ncbi:MAG: DUF507 family protein [Nitrospinota bacterium]|nr:MAG: DUF507 family protein [Nitrospinota bacterium]
MRLRKEMIAHLAKTLVHDLLKRKAIEIPPEKEEEIIGRVRHVITEDLLVEDRLNEEVREILKAYAADMARGNIEYQKMFALVKRKLIKERGLIL